MTAFPTRVEAWSFLFEHLSDGICVSAGGRILYANPAAERLLGSPRGGGGGRRLCDLLCARLFGPGGGDCATRCPLLEPESKLREAIVRGRFDLGRIFKWRDERIQSSPRSRDLRVRCLRAPAGAGEEDLRFTVIEDVSAEAELERRKQDWRDMVAHDMRSPLTSVMGALRSVQEAPWDRSLERVERDLVETAIGSVKRLVKLLDDYLSVAKLEAGLMPLRLEAVEIAPLAARCVEETAAAARARGVSVELQIPQGFKVRADPDLLLRVVQNLLDNALRYAPERGWVWIRATENEAHAQLSVKDGGPGIAPREVERIFERYYQSPDPGRRRGGTGLGLTFCREALRAMGGSIRVESVLGQGAEFIVVLPKG